MNKTLDLEINYSMKVTPEQMDHYLVQELKIMVRGRYSPQGTPVDVGYCTCDIVLLDAAHDAGVLEVDDLFKDGTPKVELDLISTLLHAGVPRYLSEAAGLFEKRRNKTILYIKNLVVHSPFQEHKIEQIIMAQLYLLYGHTSSFFLMPCADAKGTPIMTSKLLLEYVELGFCLASVLDNHILLVCGEEAELMNNLVGPSSLKVELS